MLVVSTIPVTKPAQGPQAARGQRFVAIEFDFLPRVSEIAVVSERAGSTRARVAQLVDWRIGYGLSRGMISRRVSRRACSSIAPACRKRSVVRDAVLATMIEPLTDAAGPSRPRSSRSRTRSSARDKKMLDFLELEETVGRAWHA